MLSRVREQTTAFVPANHINVLDQSIFPLEACLQRVIKHWTPSILHGILTTTPYKVSRSLQRLANKISQQGNEVVLIDGLNYLAIQEYHLNPSAKIQEQFELEQENWLPLKMYYTRPFQYQQYFQVLTTELKLFLEKHPHTRLVLLTGLLKRFLSPSEYGYQAKYPVEHVEKLIISLRRLQQYTLQYNTITIALMDPALLTIPIQDTKQKRTQEKKQKLGKAGKGNSLLNRTKRRTGHRHSLLIPIPSLFQRLLYWEITSKHMRVKLLQDYSQASGEDCTQSITIQDKNQTKLEKYFT